MDVSDVPILTPTRIGAIYIGIGIVWVLASDYLLVTVAAAPEMEGTVQTVKSVGFVMASGALIYGLTRRGQSQVRAQARELEESTDAIESLVELSPQPVVQLDLDGRVRRWNDAATDLFGWEESEVVGEPLPIVQDDDRSEYHTHLERVGDGTTIQNKEVTRKRKDGSTVPVSLSATPLRDHTGTVTSVMAVLVDIEEYKAREALLESLIAAGEQIMEATTPTAVCSETIDTATQALDIPLVGIWLIDDEETTLQPRGLSDAAAQSVDEQPTYTVETSAVGTVFESGNSLVIESEDDIATDIDLSPGDVIIPIPGHGVMIAGAGDQELVEDTDRRMLELLASFTGGALDRVHREQELASERQFIDTALDALWDIFVVVDADTGEFIRWNDRLAAISQYEGETLDQATLSDIIREEDVDATRQAVSDAAETGASVVEVGITNPDGDIIEHEFRSRRLDLPNRDRPLVVAIGRDISEQRRLERALRENERRYRTLVEMSPLPIVVHRDTTISYGNEAFRDIVDADINADLVDRSLTDFVAAEDVSTLEATAKATQEGRATPTKNRYQLRTEDGTVRHVDTTSRPIAYEGDAAVLTIVEDITDKVRHEEQLRSLHAITRDLLGAESVLETMTEAAQAGSTLLEFPDAVVFKYDETAGQLVPSIAAEGSEEYITELGSVSRGEYTPVWDAFVTGESQRLTEASEALPFTDGVLLPIGMYGVLVAGSTTSTPVDDRTMELAEILRRNLEATFDRLDREATLQERDRELARRNEELERLTQLESVVRGVNQALITATTREDIEQAVCSKLAESAAFTGVWIGERTRPSQPVTPVAGEGFELDAVATTEESDDPLHGVIGEAMDTGGLVVAHDIVENPAWSSRRRHALDSGYRTVAAIPIPVHDDIDRILVVHSTDQALFTEGSRAVFEELGQIIGNALETVGGRQAIHADEFTRTTIEIGDPSFLFNRLATETGGQVTLRGAIPSDDGVQLFLSTDASAEAIRDAVDDVAGVTYLQPTDAADSADGDTLVVLNAAVPVFDELAALGCAVQDVETDGSVTRLTIDIPAGVKVREVFAAITSVVEPVELLSREERVTTVQPPETTLAALEAACTQRQLEALRAAYYGGYYEWPRQATNENLADTLGISSATYQSHRRTAERKLVETVLD